MKSKISFSTRSMGASEFAEASGVRPNVQRDWRRRGFGEGLGQPDPKGGGRWVYSMEDALKARLAVQISDGDRGLPLRQALWCADIVTRYFVDDARLWGTEAERRYSNRYVVFFGSEGFDTLQHRRNDNLGDIMSEVSVQIGSPVMYVIDMTATFNRLPQDIVAGLRNLRSAD